MAKKINDFQFKQFKIKQQRSPMKVGTDGVLLGAWASVNSSGKILDIGTGTGLITLMVAQRNNYCLVDTVEIDRESYEEAVENIENSPWAKTIKAHHTSLQQYCLDTDQKYSCIITNPPYFTSGNSSPERSRGQARHNHTLNFHDLINCSLQLLADDGIFSLILPTEEGREFIHRAIEKGLFLSRQLIFSPKADKKPERLLLEFSLKKTLFTSEELIHYDEDGEWTKDYINLTKHFYLKL